MKIQKIRPMLYRIAYFEHIEKEHKRPRIALDKTQYAYHLLLIDRGTLEVCIGERREKIKAGDALYLLPGEVYRLLPCGEDFSLFNLFFDFLDDRFVKSVKYSECVFMNRYDPRLCLPKIAFEDAELLNQSGVIRKISCGGGLKDLLRRDPADPLYGFYGQSALFSLFASALASAQKNSAKEPILEYIQSHPEEDLSGDALSKRFSYHKNHINKRIKQRTGKSLGQYVRSIKINYAKSLLSEGLYSASEVAARLGYYDYSHFYKAFLAETGASPAEYLPN